MDVNYEVWGAPETWVDGDTTQQKAGIKFAAGTQDTYRELYTTGKLELNEMDLSASYWGIGKGSIFNMPHYLSPYQLDGETEVAVDAAAENISRPMILSSNNFAANQYIRFSERYAPDTTEAVGSTLMSYTGKVILNYNYQNLFVVPYITCKASGYASGTTTTTLYSYIETEMYNTKPEVIAIAFLASFGDGSESRSHSTIGIISDVHFPGSDLYYGSNQFWSKSGCSILYNTTESDDINILGCLHNTTTAINNTVGDRTTALTYKYSKAASSSVPIYYFDPDNDIWTINKTGVYRNVTYWYEYPYINVTSADMATRLKDYVLSQIAYLGFPFVYDPETVKTGKIGDVGVYLPKFDEDGITTGEYAEGRAALALPNAEWVDGRTGSGYDPTKPIPSEDTGDDGVEVRPSNPAFTLAGRGTQCYAITPADMTEIFTDIYGRSKGSFQDLTEGLALFGSDPMGAIISYKWYPFNFEPNTSAAIVLGTTEINPQHTYPIIQNVLNSMKNFKGTFRLKADKDFINSRATQARLYLPFYGFYELPMPQLISHELEIEFHYNVPDEVGTWIISWNNVIYDFVECDPAIEIPLTGTNARAIRQAKVGAALNIAATVAQTAATVGIGVASFSTGIAAAAGGAMGAAQALGEQGALAWGKQVATASTRATNFSTGAGIVGALANGYNGLTNAVASVNRLKVNVPFHPASDSTTFLNLSMVPYLQLYTNQPIVDYSGNSEAPRQYMLKVGIACDKWVTTSSMPDESLLKTTGIANMDISGMELSEVQELNGILQSGFYK